MNRKMLPLLILGANVLIILSFEATAEIKGCSSCDATATLTHEQIKCISNRIDSLMRRRTDPIYFDASGCMPADNLVMGGTVEITAPSPVDPTKASGLWLQLTKKQVSCLRGQIANAKVAGIESVTFQLDDETCAQASP